MSSRAYGIISYRPLNTGTREAVIASSIS